MANTILEGSAFAIIGEDGLVYSRNGWKNPSEAVPEQFLLSKRKHAEEKISWAEHYKDSTSFDPERDPGSMARAFLAHGPKIHEVNVTISL